MRMIPANTGKPVPGDGGHKDEKPCVKPFLKWAGGKGQLLKELEAYYPFDETITKYAEPFVGGGAVLFDILSRYELEAVYISDINAELINTYRVVRDEIDGLTALLSQIQTEYRPLDAASRKEYYLRKRERFNTLKVGKSGPEDMEKAALMIFLNRTCFNGLYRVNRKGLFNVPMGAYQNPVICDEENLRMVSRRLQPVTIVCGDFRESADFIDEHTFVYFDPPYRPITNTANFTAYTETLFGDAEQRELARFVEEMHRKGAKIVVSNSDPKNSNEADDFFETIYASHQIKRVEAARMINSNRAARGKIKELLISNFKGKTSMIPRDFDTWLSGFRESIAGYGYYTDFEKVCRNTESVRDELNLLNTLIGSQDIESDFERLFAEHPQILKCVPLLLAVRSDAISAMDGDGSFTYHFQKANLSVEQYKAFMRKTGLFDLLASRRVSNLADYVTGVEAGLDSAGRKNRGGRLMEDLVEGYLQKAGFVRDETYFKGMSVGRMTKKWGIDLSAISNREKFDFAVKTDTMLYGVKTSFCKAQGSRLSETARRNQTLALETEAVEGFAFVWFTDGRGWLKARDSLEEAFHVMKHIYDINDLENGVVAEIFQ